MDYIFIKSDSKEWGDMWDFVRTHPINETLDEPCTALNEGEEWQYLGSFKQGDKVISEIRHIQHPRTNEPYKIMYQHESFNNDCIAKSSRIK
jgi:hypothetical protein